MALCLIVGIVPSLVITHQSNSKGEEMLSDLSFEGLRLIRDTKSTQIEELFDFMKSQIQTLASNKLTQDAAEDFSAAFKNYNGTNPPAAEVDSALKDFYKEQFGEKFKKLNKDNSQSISGLISGLNPIQKFLQYQYIAANKHPLGEKHTLDMASDGSEWSKFHQHYHHSFRYFLEKFGYYDIFIADPESGNIVYSVYKELDFATSLKSGPYANSGIAEAFKGALNSEENDFVAMTDLAQYYPSYNYPAGFLATKIVKNGVTSGVLIFQLPVDKIDAIMTVKKDWKKQGFGNTGEVYLVGDDLKMRSNSRLFLETPEDFFNIFQAENGLVDLENVKLKEGTALNQKISTKATEELKNGKSGSSKYTGYTGNKVYGSYKKLNIEGLNWYIISEKTDEEIYQGLNSLKKILMIIFLSCIVCIVLMSFFFSGRISSKISKIVDDLRNTSDVVDQNSEQVNIASQRVSESATQQASSIQETVATLNEISAMVSKSVQNAEQSSEKSQISFDVSQEGKTAVNEMITAMKEIDNSNLNIVEHIEESNKKISEIIKVITEISEKTNIINDIVFQTKLLSFNASVEAARAGEHGKGFAVVAEEVGNLAQMSGNAAKEIADMLSHSIVKVENIVNETKDKVKRLIDNGKSKVESGVLIAERCGKVLDEVVANVDIVKSLMKEITSASQEQAEGVSNISEAMNELDSVTRNNSHVAQETSMYSKQLSRESKNLTNSIVNLDRQIFGSGSNKLHTKRPGKSPDSDNQSGSGEIKMAEVINMEKSQNSQTQDSSSQRSNVIMRTGSNSAVPSENDPMFEDV